MATVQHFRGWLTDLTRRYGADGIEVVSDSGNSHEPGDARSGEQLTVRLYTDTNQFTIRAGADERGDYLGCTASTRKPRAGEDWTRGNDLSDGPLSLDTWHRVLADIVSYEMVKVHKRAEPVADGPGGPTTEQA